MYRGKSRAQRFVGVVCAAVFLAVTLVQTIHFCELVGGSSGQQFRTAGVVNSGHAFCVLCATAHSPSLASPRFLPAQAPASAEIVQPAELDRHSSPQSFALYVRPPPLG
jgi:hypothetical protein